MKRLLLGFTIGAITGAMAYQKMQKSKLPEKVIRTAQEKLESD